MPPGKKTWVEQGLLRLTDAIFKYPRLFMYPQLALFVVCVVYTCFGLKLDFNRDNLVGSNEKYHKNYLELRKEFPVQDDLVVAVESGDPEKNRQFVERLGARLEKETGIFTNVFYKGDLKMMGNKALLFLPEPDLLELQAALTNYAPIIRDFSQATNFISLFDIINQRIRTSKRQDNAENEALVKSLPALRRIIDQARDSLERLGPPVSPGVTALFDPGGDADEKMYITSPDKSLYLVTAQAREDGGNGQEDFVKLAREFSDHRPQTNAVDRMRELMHEVMLEVPGVNAGLTGNPVLERDETEQSAADTERASIVTVILVFMIIIWGYGRVSRRIKADFCLLIGMGFTMGFTTLVIGHLNILTITFAPILIGLAIDFGVHLIARYEEEMRHGRPPREAMNKAMVFTGMGVVTGGLTTTGAFLAMGATHFKGIQEMGIICGGGLLICLVPMMTFLPALILRDHRPETEKENASKEDLRFRIEQAWLGHPGWAVGITLLLCALALTQWGKVGFDYNLLHMQSKDLPAVEAEYKLIHSAGRSVLYGEVVAENADAAAALEAKLQKLPSVHTNESLSQYLRGDQTHQLEVIGQIKQAVAPIHFAATDTQPVDVPELSRTLNSFSGYLGQIALDKDVTNNQALVTELRLLQDAILELRRTMNGGIPGRVDLPAVSVIAAKLAAYQQAFFNDIRDTFNAIQTQDNRSRMRAEDLPPALRNRFVGVHGKLLIQVYPAKEIWDRQPQEEFVRELRSVDPNVTGNPVQLYEYTDLLQKSYRQAAGYAMLAVMILVYFHFRSVVCVGLALLPVGVGFLWMVGMMGVSGVLFNPANIMTLPLVIGIGVTNGIHILNRFAEEGDPGILGRSTGKAVLVSGLTAMVGFGSLMLGKHQGIASLGFVMSVGVAACMIVGLTFLPAVLTLLYRRGWTIKRPSGDNAQSTPGREEPRL